MSQENVEIVRAFFDAYRVDIDAGVALAHPEIELRMSIVGGLEGEVYRGRDGLRRLIAEVDASWAEFRMEIDELRDLGDTVLVLGRSFGRGGASGIVLERPAGWVAVIRDGMVHRFASFTSRERALQAVGLSE